MLRHTDQRGGLPAGPEPGGALRERVAAMSNALRTGLRRPQSQAIETLCSPATMPSSSAATR
ncbi:hypothetical protein [Nocardia jiangsuensis]|uniref:Uncharacterized protein n=1 Tax=Nocardia jiangsuensis TaxID=1691563 RepID=A0ABV8DRN2_9NOCA